MSTCRSCGASIRWAITERSGKRIPVDPDPVDDGNLVLRDAGGGDVIASVVAPGELLLDDPGVRFVSHFATCPHADQHRNRTS